MDTSGLRLPLRTAEQARALLDRHFQAQDRKPSWLREAVVTELAPVCRALLVTDGTLTSMLEAHLLEPVEVTRVVTSPLGFDDARRAWLLPCRADMTHRRARIRGRQSARAYVTAESILVDAAIPARLLTAVQHSPRGLGAALAESGLEARRELLWYGLAGTAGRPEATVSRSYRIFMAGRPVIFVEETFHTDALITGGSPLMYGPEPGRSQE